MYNFTTKYNETDNGLKFVTPKLNALVKMILYSNIPFDDPMANDKIE
jgi:hypothetical protein